MTFWQTLSLFMAPIGGIVIWLFVFLDQRRDARRMAKLEHSRRR